MSETPKCEYLSCDREATHRIRFIEDGTPTTAGYYCREHKNTEQIHDPVNTEADRLDG